MHFMKFETARIQEAVEFIQAKGLHRVRPLHATRGQGPVKLMATGGGAYKYAGLLKAQLGVEIAKADEMECLVNGCNFLLQAIHHEAFTYQQGTTSYVHHGDHEAMWPYLLVNIGSGVSIIKVDGEGRFQRVSGSSLGGGTFWGLARLLTGCQSFDEVLELSAQGDNKNVDMLVGDIYGNRDYTNIGLAAETIASSFGKVISNNKPLGEYHPGDMGLALCRMITFNIAQLAYLNAVQFGLERIYFGGFFIRNHAFTMGTLSEAIQFWSQGKMSALFLRHEGFLGALGAYLQVNQTLTRGTSQAVSAIGSPRQVRSHVKERFPMGAPFTGGSFQGAVISDLHAKISWVEKFVRAGDAFSPEHSSGSGSGEEGGRTQKSLERAPTGRASLAEEGGTPLAGGTPGGAGSLQLHVGVLHFSPTLQPFPLLADPQAYSPSTPDLMAGPHDWEFWLDLLEQNVPTMVAKAEESEGPSPRSRRRAQAAGRGLSGHLARLREQPTAYGGFGISDLLELRENTLREFGFRDIYKRDKERENHASLAVLPDLLREIDAQNPKQRLVSLIEGVLAANIFDWGAKACVSLYQSGQILEIYRQARTTLSKRPWRYDDLDSLEATWLANWHGQQACPQLPYPHVLMFVDNAGADIILGMLPLAREALRMGADVTLAANELPAINDITAHELRHLVHTAASMCDVIKEAWHKGGRAGIGCEVGPPREGGTEGAASSGSLHGLEQVQEVEEKLGEEASTSQGEGLTKLQEAAADGNLKKVESTSSLTIKTNAPPTPPPRAPTQGSSAPRVGRLRVVSSGQTGPCLDLRYVHASVAALCGTDDLVVFEGMGRAVHTNYHTQLQSDCLKLAMIKTGRVAEQLLGGKLYDCVCRFDRGVGSSLEDGARL